MEGISFVPLVILVVVLLVFIFLNVPVAFALAFTAIIVGISFIGPSVILNGVLVSLAKMQSFVLLSIPLFVYMGVQLKNSGEAGVIYGGIYRIAGGFRGSLAITTVITGTLIAAMSGISGTVALAVMALPLMDQFKYDRKLAMGTVSVAGALGTLIPPSVVMILYGEMAGVSIGKLYLGGVIPGLILAGLSIIYIIIIARNKPEVAPAFALSLPAKEKLKEAVNVLPALLLIGAIMYAMYGGLATPTEASVIGAVGAVIISLARRKMSFGILKSSLRETFTLNAMIMFLLIGGSFFGVVFVGLGGIQITNQLFAGLGGGFWGPVIFTQILLMLLGCILDIASIIIITVPIFVPILVKLGVNPLWFGVLFTVNMELAYLTPPFGMNLFYMRAMVASDISMGDIYRSQVPFLVTQIITLGLIMAVPALALWLPSLI